MSLGTPCYSVPLSARAEVCQEEASTLDWDEIYCTTKPGELHWHPGEPDKILRKAVKEDWLNGHAVLDIGCGRGTDSVYLAQQGYSVVGLDSSRVACEIALAAAKRSGTTVLFVVGDALRLPFVDEQFDVVTDRGCFHHIDKHDRSTFAGEMARVLKPGSVYFYRNLFRKSQFNIPDENRLTEDEVRETFHPYFEIRRFEECEALGVDEKPFADMHWGLFERR